MKATINREKQEQVQEEVTNLIIKNNYNGLYIISPRVGKTKIVIDALNKSEVQNVLVATYNLSVLDNWKKESTIWKLDKSINIDYITFASLNTACKNYDLLIVDECQLASDNNLDFISNSKLFNNKILLTGTLNQDNRYNIKQKLKMKVLYEYSVDEAVKDDIIQDYRIKIIPCQLDNIKKTVSSGTLKKPFLTTEQGHYNFLTAQFERFKYLAYSNPSMVNVKYLYATKRKSLLSNSLTKIEVCKELIKEQDRCLIFTADTKTADILSKKSYHSKNNKASNTNLQDFVSGKIKKLSCCKIGSQGLTFKNLNTIVIHQINSNEESTVQKALRACTKTINNEPSIIYITAYENTKDWEWCMNSLKDFDQNKILIISKKL